MDWPILRIKWSGYLEVLSLDDSVMEGADISTTETWPKKFGSAQIQYLARVDKYQPTLGRGVLHLRYAKDAHNGPEYQSRKLRDFRWGSWELSWSRPNAQGHAMGDAVWHDDKYKEPRKYRNAVKVLMFNQGGPSNPGFETARRRKRPDQRDLKELLLAQDRACAITGETQSDALDAAHIVQHTKGNFGLTSNGILLRADLHRLFDAQLIGIKNGAHGPRFVCAKTVSQTYRDAVHHKPLNPAVFQRIERNLAKRDAILAP